MFKISVYSIRVSVFILFRYPIVQDVVRKIIQEHTEVVKNTFWYRDPYDK